MGLFDKLSSKPNSKPTNTNNNYSNPYSSTTQSSSQNNNQFSPSIGNVDNRPLPTGWEKQWHDGYQRYFYIDTNNSNGPQSHWIHPIDQQNLINNNNQPIHSNNYHNPPNIISQPYFNRQQTNYVTPQTAYQQPPVQATNTKKPGFNPLLAGAGGLAGGMLLGSMIEGHHHHHHDNDYMNGYEQGYENGYDNGFDNGDDFGGGDFGGGDFGGGDFF